jgi:hypothetical protein
MDTHKVIEGLLGTTIDVVLINGLLKVGDIGGKKGMAVVAPWGYICILKLHTLMARQLRPPHTPAST